ncbi:MAG: serine protease [Elusimicrobiales bacterium]|nr:serine protease [Elusimicrobiales bacterium]
MKLILFTLMLVSASTGAYCADRTIYGEDNRRDYWDLSEEHRELADSVVSIWHDSMVGESADKTFYTLDTRASSEAPSVYCPGLKFENQKAGAKCSGSFLGEDLVMTAGHCVLNFPGYGCENMKIVFGFHLQKDGTSPEKIAASDIYSCREVVARYVDTEVDEQNLKGGDYAIIRLDRVVKGKKPLEVNPEGEAKAGTPVFVMGYPFGLPLKMADGASIRNTDQKDSYYMADLDTFGGNSGSPVFNSATKRIEGILVKGDEDLDYLESGHCFTNHINPQNGGRGEDITKISLVRGIIAKSLHKGGKIQTRDISLQELADNSPEILPGVINFDLKK